VLLDVVWIERRVLPLSLLTIRVIACFVDGLRAERRPGGVDT